MHRSFCKSFWSLVCLGVLASAAGAQISLPEYASLQSEFASLHGETVFPVANRSSDDIESTFGPRIQASTGLYDFHRGFDVDGTQGDDILAITDGVFWEQRIFPRGGLSVILRHNFASPQTIGGNDYDHYFTYYLHLFDDDIAGNGVGTLDLIDGWVSEKESPGLGTVVVAGDHIAELGSSGSSGGLPYADHLHLDLRVGANASLIFQTENPDTTQHGFDPHLHPSLLFEPPTFGGPENSPTLTLSPTASADADVGTGEDLRIVYENSNLAPLLNRLEFSIFDSESDQLLDSHVLDFGLRSGYDASEEVLLDTQDVLLPYISPLPFGDSATSFQTAIVIPQAWLGSVGDRYRLEVDAFDIWSNPTTFQLTVVPEPGAAGVLFVLLLCQLAGSRKRGVPKLARQN